MYTYTFPHEHLKPITDHMVALQIVVNNLNLNDMTYTMSCTTQIDNDQYQHLNQQYSLMEVV